ncbi:MAG: hypothetical protein EOP88_00310 [Verrucomicrobiaceae bacterium]|nr:MAG: hypothetical protein EOP88_00310 [Verrucomicrobiaceae bacterium]
MDRFIAVRGSDGVKPAFLSSPSSFFPPLLADRMRLVNRHAARAFPMCLYPDVSRFRELLAMRCMGRLMACLGMTVACLIVSASAQSPGDLSPVAVADRHVVIQNQALVVVAPGVLSNDTDPESAALAAALQTPPEHGTVDLAADGGFTYTPAADYSGTDFFTYTASNGHSVSEETTVTLKVHAAAVEVLGNGSFEAGLDGWTVTGNLGLQSSLPYRATHGTTLLSFNDINRPANAVIRRSFRTLPGQTYTLDFDAGVFAYNTSAQKIQVAVDGTTNRLTQTVTMNGVGGGNSVWFPQHFTFVADRPSCTITFRDQSATSANVDLLLDHVRITGPDSENFIPVALPDQYSAIAGRLLSVAAAGVLANDSDGNESTLTPVLLQGAEHGTLALAANGSFTYTAAAGYIGADTFIYRVFDGEAYSEPATVTIVVSVHAAPPTAILLNPAIVMENGKAGDLVGVLTAVDADVGDIHTFSLVSGEGSSDNAGFVISGNRLLLRYGAVAANGKYLDFETQSVAFPIRVRATDVSGQFVESPFYLLFGDDRTEDVDGDGLTEAEEEDIHGTSDLVFDTDADGFGDRYESLGHSSPEDPQSWPEYPVIGWGGNASGELRSPDHAPFYKIATGQQHSLGLRTDGTVAAWAGANQYGQLSVPAGLRDVVAVAAGGDFWISESAHSLALKRDGTVVAWGCNSDGQVSVPAGLSDVTRIAAGRAHSLALKQDGTVVAWGCNLHGQCIVPAGLDDVIAIAAGGFYSIALKSDGTLVSWGDNFNGIEWTSADAPAGLCDVVAISAGRFHTLALRSDGSVVAWGYNLDGQANVPAGLSDVVAVAAGGFHSMALKADGSVVEWGSDRSGQALVPASAHSQVKAISAGLLHSLAIRETGSFPAITSSPLLVSAPGEPVSHQVTVVNAEPVRYAAIGLPEGLELDPVTGLISGTLSQPVRRSVHLMVETSTMRLTQALWVHVFSGMPPAGITLAPAAVTENSPAETEVGVLAAEDADEGDIHVYQLVAGPGDADNARFRIAGDRLMVARTLTRDFEQDPAPFSFRVRARDASMNLYEQVISISFRDDRNEDADRDGLTEAEEEDIHGSSDTTYDTDGDGFGDGFEISRGTSPTGAASFPSGQILVAWGSHDHGQLGQPPVDGEFTALAAGWRHNLALLADGSLTAWGWNDHGQCTLPPELSGVVAVDAGDYHSLALKGDGSVVAWGGNEFGQASVPEGLAGVVAIAAGSYHSLALMEDGTVVAWGDNANGQATVPAGLSGVTAIAAGGYHNLALKNDGTVVAWGSDWSGATIVPDGLSRVVAIAAGGFHSLALTSNGMVTAWGASEAGQSAVPSGLADVEEVKAGWLHGVAVKRNGSVVAWGGNGKGQATVPLEAKDVRTVAAGDFHNVALRRAAGFPRIETAASHQSWPGDVVSHPVTVSGANAISFKASGLPAGLEVDPVTGLISGTITRGGKHAVRITAETDKGRLTRVIWMDTSEGRAPTGINLDSAPVSGSTVFIRENSPAGTLFGVLSAVDPDLNDTHHYNVVVVAGSANSYCFTVSGNELRVAGPTGVDFESPGAHTMTIRVRASDSADHYIERNFTIQMVDDRTEDADGDGINEAMEEDVFFTSDTVFTNLATLDTDKDGIPALIEYAFNMNMRSADAGLRLGGTGSTAGLPLVNTFIDGSGNRRLRMEYLRRVGSRVIYIPQFSSGLSDSSWSDAQQLLTPIPVNGEWERCVVEDGVTSGARFGRIKVRW